MTSSPLKVFWSFYQLHSNQTRNIVSESLCVTIERGEGTKQKNRSIRIAIVNRDLMFYCDVRCLSLFFIYVKLIDISMVMRLVFRGRRRWETRRCKTCKSTSWRRSVKFVRVNWSKLVIESFPFPGRTPALHINRHDRQQMKILAINSLQ